MSAKKVIEIIEQLFFNNFLMKEVGKIFKVFKI